MRLSSYPRLRARSDSLQATLRNYWLVIGIGAGLWLISLGRFAAYGFSWPTFVLWLAALVCVAQVARLTEAGVKLRAAGLTGELAAVGVLLLVFAPLYLLFLNYLPNQVITDEISLMIYERRYLTRPINLLGVSPYFGFPALPFIVFGRLGLLLGGIDLANMRFVHACFGLAIIVLAYAFFRLHLDRPRAAGAAALLGANHALLGISRIAEWANLSLLAELLALTVLMVALRRGSLRIAMLGGFLAGAAFYVYLPGRVTIVIWLIYLGACWLLRTERQGRRMIVRCGVASALGCLLVAAPILVRQLKDTRVGADYYKKGLLIFPEGRELQRWWMNAETVTDGLRINLTYGLTAFNNQEHDRGFIYDNRGHGFLDPLTGGLLWLGVYFAVREFLKGGQAQDGYLLSLTGFVFLWLTLSFVINQAPNYNRMLVALPFVAFLASAGLQKIAELPFLPKLRLPTALRPLRGNEWLAVGVLTIVVMNLWIYSQYLRSGFEQGSVVGNTARLVARRSEDPDHSFYLYADAGQPYYGWGEPGLWEDWIETFVVRGQFASIYDGQECQYTEFDAPFTAFMNAQTWELCRRNMLEQFPELQIENILPDGSRLAIEVL
jgi:hypothetical protein